MRAGNAVLLNGRLLCRRTGSRPPPCLRLADLGLAVGADLPARVERLPADGARLLQPAQAARAAEKALLDLEPAVLAVLVLEFRTFRGTLIVNAPDYMHRGINGYQWWPSGATRSGVTNGRRWVSLTGDQGLSRINGFGQQPVVGVAGGQIFNSGNQGGGGR